MLKAPIDRKKKPNSSFMIAFKNALISCWKFGFEENKNGRIFSKKFKFQRKYPEYCRNSIYLPKSIACQCQQKNFRDSYSWKRHVPVNGSRKYGFLILKKFYKLNYLISSSNESLWLWLPSFEHDLVCHQSSCKVFPYA